MSVPLPHSRLQASIWLACSRTSMSMLMRRFRFFYLPVLIRTSCGHMIHVGIRLVNVSITSVQGFSCNGTTHSSASNVHPKGCL